MKTDSLAPSIDIPHAPPAHRHRLRATWCAVVMAGALTVAPAATEAADGTESSTQLTPEVLREIELVRARIAATEAQTLARVATPPDNQVQRVEVLGKALLYDEQLSVNRNEACAFCHMPED